MAIATDELELNLDPRLRAIMEQEFPHFSEGEYRRREERLAELMDRRGVDHLLTISDHNVGNATQWLTAWPGTTEAYVVFKPGEQTTMIVEQYNHYPLSRRIARPEIEDRWGENQAALRTAEELGRRGARRVGVIGPLLYPAAQELGARFEIVDLTPDYMLLRTIKSQEELDWLRIAAALTDRSLAALKSGIRPGMTERELANLVERAYVPLGGTNQIHFIGVTSMANPHIYVPPQFPSSRRVQEGDVVFCELSAYWWDYAAQVLRTFTVAGDPTDLYRDLQATAERAFDAVTAVIHDGTTMEEIVEAATVIEDAGYTICDDLMHGYGGGYLPPVLGSKSRPAGPLPDMVLREDMTVVVQPNPITTDKRAGVQFGELIHVTKTGFERLHTAPRGFERVGG
jgi:Xaa-Pro aminopeptidase